jgi:hypothetical protein
MLKMQYQFHRDSNIFERNVCPLFYCFPEILTLQPFFSYDSGAVGKDAAIISGLVGEAKDRVQMELDGQTGDTDSELLA